MTMSLTLSSFSEVIFSLLRLLPPWWAMRLLLLLLPSLQYLLRRNLRFDWKINKATANLLQLKNNGQSQRRENWRRRWGKEHWHAMHTMTCIVLIDNDDEDDIGLRVGNRASIQAEYLELCKEQFRGNLLLHTSGAKWVSPQMLKEIVACHPEVLLARDTRGFTPPHDAPI